ncbi:hypothetical protein SH528x_002289 [Novipirellula sp. SH528]|uniref:hypothetical protein n=1 Tax=Novipirellula sp. SH528 TaxID=3454466 RepID=UPI003F9FDE23
MTSLNSPTISHPRISGQYVQLEGATWYKISNSHLMSPFFMSAVSSSDHWMFISSRGSLTAGRHNPDSALFPYYSADKIADTAAHTGPKTLLRVLQDGAWVLWEPFSTAPIRDGARTQNLYKNSFGNRILFEEIHHLLGIAFRYAWTSGHQFGFIRSCELVNLNDVAVQVEVTDGLQNMLPAGLGKDFQLRYSNLADAYKKSELQSDSGLGLYYLSSVPTDRAEPSEGLRATVAWQHGLNSPTIALSDTQLDQVRNGADLVAETEVRGRRGAFLASKRLELQPLDPVRWRIVADLNNDHCDVIKLQHRLIAGGDVGAALEQDAVANETQLLKILSAADGRQLGANQLRIQRHQSNVLFNVMRGGLPAHGYEINTTDFHAHVRGANRLAEQRNATLWNDLPKSMRMDELNLRVAETKDPDLIRIASEYLPLYFSRRHGDPTRPWNAYSIDVRSEDGSENLSYEGNWRDIFQNWEALAVAYPHFATSMVLRFVNASTADGYNPYRITKNGFDWEVPDPNDPWTNIGYWGDHQIIYLLKLLERCRAMTPTHLNACLSQPYCTYADIPYRIRPYAQICRDPQVTIDFDFEHADEIDQRVKSIGGDGKLIWGDDGEPYHVGLIEKLLVPALTKLTNFVPEGGVWLNTQRPEWNDANNALVGRGLSVVTACYLRRYMTFLIDWFTSPGDTIPETVAISAAVCQLADRVKQVFEQHADAFDGPIDDHRRKQILDALSITGEDYRDRVYSGEICNKKKMISLASLVDLFRQARTMIDHTIRRNRRDDGLYHSYNLMHLEDDSAPLSHLYEMLEGQVAVISSGLLSPRESLAVLDALRRSKIYREDQQSYMLYPDRELPRFLEKNQLTKQNASRSRLLTHMLSDQYNAIVQQDIHGELHFNSKFCNVSDLNIALDRLQQHSKYGELAQQERSLLNEIFEQTFGHRHFTGRSGTFFAYEGLGSIYWHMVSKLALAVMEQCMQVRGMTPQSDSDLLKRLHTHYCEIRDGIGLTKTPSQYGAFPSDPYSHTPRGAGVQQPGMTGQVKEDILSRWDELGIRIDKGQLRFDPVFFESSELLQSDAELVYFDVQRRRIALPVSAGCFAMTLCQVPIFYRPSDRPELSIHYADQPTVNRDVLMMTAAETDVLFRRRGEITRIEVSFVAPA